MKVLGIDTSGNVCSVALVDDERVLFEYTTNYKRTHSITLMPIIEELFRVMEIEKSDIDLYAISAGPGSFTGLRIGSATVKSMAQVFHKPIASIPTLEVIANNITYTDALICTMIDARRENVYYQFFEYQGNNIVSVSEMSIDNIDVVIEALNITNRKVMLLGDGVKVNNKKISENLNVEHFTIKMNNNMQKGSTVGMLGLKYFDKGMLEDYLEHAPIYLRKSQAEQELEKKQL